MQALFAFSLSFLLASAAQCSWPPIQRTNQIGLKNTKQSKRKPKLKNKNKKKRERERRKRKRNRRKRKRNRRKKKRKMKPKTAMKTKMNRMEIQAVKLIFQTLMETLLYSFKIART